MNKPKWTPKYMLITSYMSNKHKTITVPKKVHTYDTIQQFVEEFETDWDNQRYEVLIDNNGNAYTVVDCLFSCRTLGTIRMSKECALRLCDMLNNNEVEL